MAEPNSPMTLTELQQLGQAPIWVVRGDGAGRWALIRFVNQYGIATHGCGFLSFDEWQVDWWAFHCNPATPVPADPPSVPTWAEHFRARFERTE